MMCKNCSMHPKVVFLLRLWMKPIFWPRSKLFQILWDSCQNDCKWLLKWTATYFFPLFFIFYIPPILDLNGNILSTAEEKLNTSREHFASVLCHIVSTEVPPFAPTTESISPARSIPQTSPSKSVIVSAIKSMSSGKAAGIDGIPAQFYKSNL